MMSHIPTYTVYRFSDGLSRNIRIGTSTFIVINRNNHLGGKCYINKIYYNNIGS